MENELEGRPTVSFVLPAYNEGEFIEDTLRRLDHSFSGNGFRYEILVVDDGSSDDTRSKASRYAALNGHVKVVGYDKNVGKGFAIKNGFWKTCGDAVVFIDSDSDVDVQQVQRYIEALDFGDIVIGSKWHPDSVVEAPIVRMLLSRCFNLFARLLTGVRVGDTQTGIKAIRREVFAESFRRLSVKRYAFDVELLVLAKAFGLRVTELPVKLKVDRLFSLREGWLMFLDLLGISYRLRVKKWYRRAISKY
jgi:glycosyltransferase involved in cell wall biosynthesis